jgi:hypothetical protein
MVHFSIFRVRALNCGAWYGQKFSHCRQETHLVGSIRTVPSARREIAFTGQANAQVGRSQ